MTRQSPSSTRLLVLARAFSCMGILLAGLGLGTPAALAQTNIVGNGSFESPAITSQTKEIDDDSSALAPWVIGGESIDVVRSFWTAADGQQSIDLNGDGPGSIRQTLATVPGRSYKLSFKFSAHPSLGGAPAAMTVRWGPSGSPTFTEVFTFTGTSTKSNMGWVTVERTVQATSTSTVLSFTSNSASNRNYGVALDDVRATVLVNLATPSLIRAVASGGTGVTVYGRVDGAANLPITLQIYAAASCTSGVLVGGNAVGTPIPVTTDPNGYFAAALPSGVPAGNFVAAKVTTPVATPTSGCLVSSGDNDAWPKALQVIDSAPTARDYIDSQGKARWYKFDVLPGQRVTVTLTGLPADYDLAVFKDIGAAFLAQIAPADTAALTKLSAEYAPSVFSPSVFSPSVFSPSVFSPDAYSPSVFSPSVFSPSVFSPSVFSPSVFSPSVFSPSVFSPSVFSPSVFSPSVFSPSVFSPSVFSPSVFSPTEIAQAFSSAQTRSIIGVSATPGTGDEVVVVNTWSNKGSFYVRVAGRAGAYTTENPFTISVAKSATSCSAVADTTLTPRAPAAGAGIRTVILTDSSKLADDGTLAAKLAAFAARPEIGGVVVDVRNDPRVGQLKAQAAANAACPYATNLVAEEIKGIVDSYRQNNPGLRYVVIAGNDTAIPFFRYPDQSLLGQESGYVPPVKSDSASEASLRTDWVLSQDAYGAGTQVSLRASNYPVPGLAVGRLVETPAEIAGMLDAYTTAGGVVAPGSSLVTGYDFLEDAANAVRSELAAGTGQVPDTLITPNGKSPQDPASWTATQLGQALLGRRHDLIFLAGHFSANSALAADFTTSLITTDLAASATDFTNAIVFSAGCHSGYNLVDTDAIAGVTLPLDWAQAFAQKKATLIAGTGYQYGDTDFLEYSERLYNNFARQLRAGAAGSAVAVGEALVKAKLDYLATTPDIRGIHEKALLEATLFGLPMLGVNMPQGRGAIAGPAGAITPVAATWPASASAAMTSLGLMTADQRVAPSLTARSALLVSIEPPQGNVTANWWEGPNGVVSNPAEPALPLAAINATPTTGTLVLRGVGFRGGVYADDVITPLTGAPTNELRGVHVPFVSPVFFPMRPWTVNYFGSLGGNGATNVLVTPTQHRAADIALGTSVRRTYANLDLRLFYSANRSQASLSDAPSIVAADAQPDGVGGVLFTAQVVGDPAAAINQVWVTYTGDNAGAWKPLDLVQCVGPSLPALCSVENSQVWKGRLDPAATPANIRYVLQAANGYGLVTLDDNLGAYYGIGGAAQAATTVVLGSVPAGATFGDSPTVTATLTSGGQPLANKTVIVAIGGAARVGTTDSSGLVTVKVPLVSVPGNYRVVASFSGDQGYLPSSASAPTFVVSKAPTSVTSLTGLGMSAFGATLSGTIGGKTQALIQETVKFSVFDATGTTLLRETYVITDYLGRAPLPPTGLPIGSYNVTAYFAGNATYTPASAPLTLAIAAQTIDFGGVVLPAELPPGGTVTFTVTSGSGQPVQVTLSPNPSPYCTLSGSGNTYTVTATAPGKCTIVASAAGTTTFQEVEVRKDIAIKGLQTIAFGPLSDKVYLTPPLTLTASATSNLPVTFTSTTPAVCSTGGANGATVTLLAAGTCTIDATQDGNLLWFAAPKVTQSFSVTKAPQAITFAPPVASGVYGSTFAVSATANSGLAVTIAASGACTIAGGTVTMTSGTGICTLTASQAGNSNYSAAADVVRTVTAALAPQAISPVPLTITPAAPTYVAGGAGTFTVTATAPGGTVTFATTPTTTCTASGAVVTMKSGGPCTITADQPGNANYQPAPRITQVVNIGKAAQTITFTGPGNQTFGVPPPALVATATSGLTVTFAASGNCTVAGTALTLTAPGACTITASQLGDTSFAAATDVAVTIAIATPDLANAWTLLPARLATARFYHTATRFESGPLAGSVLIAGGQGSDEKALASSEIYNPVTRTFSSAGNLPSKASGHTATLLQSGKVIVFGGGNSSVQAFDPATRTWSSAGSLSSNRSFHTATLLPDGRVLVIGGSDNSGSTLASTIIYNPAGAGSYANGPVLDTARERHTATLLPNGKVLVVGGRKKSGSGYTTLATYQLCDATACTASMGGIAARYAHGAVALGTDGSKVLVAGGANGSADVGSAELYDATAGTWTSTGLGSLTPARRYLTVSPLPNGRALAAGGGTGGYARREADAYAPPIAPVAPMVVKRAAHTATPLKNAAGVVTGILVVGGTSETPSDDDALNTAEIYGTP